MNKPLIWMGLVAIVGGAAYVAYNTNGELAGHATGANSAKEAVWSELSGLEDSYLKEWGDAFEEGNPSAIDVLEAFNEVGFAVTGQGGLCSLPCRPIKAISSTRFGSSARCMVLNPDKLQ